MKINIRSHAGVALAALMVFQLSPKPLFAAALPANYAMPAGTVNTNQPGFRVRPYQTDATGGGTIAWNESQQAGLQGPNVANLTGADANGYFTVPTVVNWSIAAAAVNGFPPGDPDPGLPGSGLTPNENFSEQVLTYIEFPAAGTYILGVNSDDGFGVTASVLNPKDQSTAIRLGAFDGNRGSGDTTFVVDVAQAGIYPFRLLYWNTGGGENLAWFSVITNSTSTNFVLINDIGTPGALKAYATATVAPPYATAFNSTPASFSFVIQDDISALVPSSLQVQLNGAAVTVTTSKVGTATTVTYSAPAPFASGSSNVVSAQFSDNAVPAHNLSAAFTFLVQPYIVLTPNLKVAADTSKPGFKWNIFANAGNTTPSNARTEAALAGQLMEVDGVTPLANNANPAAQGVAIAAAGAPSPANAPIKFEIAGSLNLDIAPAVGTTNGNFYPDGQMPGLPALDSAGDGAAAEAITYISLPAGLVAMGINSDDGFRTTTGLVPQDVVGSIKVAQFNGARTSADTMFYLLVQEAGVYAFRTSWQNSTTTGNIEWFTMNGTKKVLVNDIANGGLASYRALTTPIPPYVKYVSPEPVQRVLNQSSRSLVVVLSDGTTALDDNSIVLKLDGSVVTPTKARSGSQVTLTYTPTGLQFPGDEHLAELTFSTVGGTSTTTQKWSFFNLLNIVLPSPVLTENFDSTAEGGVPTSWIEWNFSDTGTAGLDLDNLNSDTYKAWVVVDRVRLEGLKSRIFQVAPGQTVNGVEVTVDTLSTGNLLYAETDVRGGNQVQFLKTSAFNLSTVTNVALSFGSLYEQNQDNLGAVEYSVDGGTNWLPVVYYLDQQDGGGDIRFNADGSVDAVTTLTAPNPDTAAWTDAGIPKGDKYGDGIAAPITPALGRFIYPRVNDNSIEGKRLEIFRLPSAGKKSDVRLRFAQLGTGSWYFGVDNIAFYSVAAPPVVAPEPMPSITSITASGGNVTVTWPGGAGIRLQKTTTLTNSASWADIASTLGNSTYTEPLTATPTYYRLYLP